MNSVLDLSERLSVLPILHGSGDFALQVRRHLMNWSPDCVALPLPPSFAEPVEQGVNRLPQILRYSENIHRRCLQLRAYRSVPGVISAALRPWIRYTSGLCRSGSGSYEENELVLPDP